MNLIDYIKGNRRGKGANHIERESMRDPLLRDAIEGFDSVASEDHSQRIESLRQRIAARSGSYQRIEPAESADVSIMRRRGLRNPLTWMAAAMLTGVVAVGTSYVRNWYEERQMILAQNNFEARYINAGTGVSASGLATATEMKIIVSHDSKLGQSARLYAEASSIGTVVVTGSMPQGVRIRAVTAVPDVINSIAQDNSSLDACVEPADRVMIAFNDAKNQGEAKMYEEIDEKSYEGEIDNDLSANNAAAKVGKIEILKIQSSKRSTAAKSSVAQETVVVGYGAVRLQKNIVPDSISTIKYSNPSSRPVVGNKAYDRYIRKNMILKEEQDIVGSVLLAFRVDKDGRPYDLRIIQSLNENCDKEAMRLIEHGPDWKYVDDGFTLRKIDFRR